MEIIEDLELIKKLANENENWEFLDFLKNYNNKKEILGISVKILNDLNKKIDCTKCGNCCRNNILILEENDINRFSTIFKINKDEYITKYLSKYESQNIYIMNQLPCPYLKDNKCTIYKYRANSCKVYPELDTFQHIISIGNIIKNSSICPIIFNFYEKLKIELRYK